MNRLLKITALVLPLLVFSLLNVYCMWRFLLLVVCDCDMWYSFFGKTAWFKWVISAQKPYMLAFLCRSPLIGWRRHSWRNRSQKRNRFRTPRNPSGIFDCVRLSFLVIPLTMTVWINQFPILWRGFCHWLRGCDWFRACALRVDACLISALISGRFPLVSPLYALWLHCACNLRPPMYGEIRPNCYKDTA